MARSPARLVSVERPGGIGAAMRHRLALLAAATAALAAVLSPVASAAPAHHCAAIRDPYPNTRFAGESITNITAKNVGCVTARFVARGAHRKALGLTPSVSGIRTFSFNGWHVTGDLRPVHDRYVATKAGAVVRWRF
jgi:hypothetical protein